MNDLRMILRQRRLSEHSLDLIRRHGWEPLAEVASSTDLNARERENVLEALWVMGRRDPERSLVVLDVAGKSLADASVDVRTTAASMVWRYRRWWDLLDNRPGYDLDRHWGGLRPVLYGQSMKLQLRKGLELGLKPSMEEGVLELLSRWSVAQLHDANQPDGSSDQRKSLR